MLKIEKFIGEITDAVRARGGPVNHVDDYANFLRELERRARDNEFMLLLLRRTLEIAEADTPLKQRMIEIGNMLMEAVPPQTDTKN